MQEWRNKIIFVAMLLLNEVKRLVSKELTLEWRSKYAFAGVLLYVVSTIFIAKLSFVFIPKLTWNALFWIIILFAAVNAMAKSFMQESRGSQLYISLLASSAAVLLAKIIYNSLLMLLLTFLAFAFFSMVFGLPPEDLGLYSFAVFLGSISFATLFTLISAISSKAGNGGVLMAILSFPIIIPVILVLTKLAKNALDGLDRSVSLDEVLTLLIINVLAIVFSLLLFPYLYRD